MLKSANKRAPFLQLAIPQSFQLPLLEAVHDSLGHQGSERVYFTLRERFWWHHMYANIRDYVKTCDTCQRIKRNYHHHPAPLIPLPPGDTFSRVHIDHANMPPVDGYKYILLIRDSFSGWCEAFPTKSQDATTTAELLYNGFITKYGAPKSIISDRHPGFMSKVVNHLCKLFNIKRCYTSSYNPQSNAVCERTNQSIWQI